MESPVAYRLLDDAAKNACWAMCETSGALELIEAFNTSLCLVALSKLGIADHLRNCDQEVNLNALASGLNQVVLEGVLTYLGLQGIVERSSLGVRLTAKGRELCSPVSLAQLGFYVSAYGGVTNSIEGLLSNSLVYGRDVVRDGKELGRHCATLFHEFHTDTILTALSDLEAKLIVDLGCGGGQFLVDACLRDATIKGIGVDISPGAIEFAQELAREKGVDNRANFYVGDAFDFKTWPSASFECDAICAVGVVHEHFRQGEQAVVQLLDTYAEILGPKIKSLILGEPEIRMDRVKSDSDLFLVHVLTGQGFPRAREDWLPIFSQSKLACKSIYTRVDAGPRFNFFDLRLRN